MSAIDRWLAGVGLERYAALFKRHAIDLDVLPDLTDADLQDLGIPLGHRKKLLKAIRAWRGPPQASPSIDADAERRQLTIVFCDLVGSTALAARMDPEDLRKVVLAYQRCCASAVERYGGRVVQYLGDGVLAYFGYPRAMEHDPERAVRAALEVVAATRALEPAPKLRLQTRVGIATGEVVVGEPAQAPVAMGETPNKAARLQALAAPDTVAVSSTVRKLTLGLFDFADLGHHVLKGFPDPVQVWQVLGPRPAENRFQATRGAAGLTPLVGRREELSVLKDCWRRAVCAHGQVVLLSGEPGIGKSRLVQALKTDIETQAGHRCAPGQPDSWEFQAAASQTPCAPDVPVRIEYSCAPFLQNSALYPVIEHLRRSLGLERRDLPEQNLLRLEDVLKRYDFDLTQVVPLFAALLSIPSGDRYPAPPLTPQKQREKTLEALASWLLQEAKQRPVLLVVEDLQWADPSTLALLDLVIRQTSGARLLALLTFRPEFDPPWPASRHYTAIRLSRLNVQHALALVEQVTQGRALPKEVLGQVLAKTDGVPLFVEELVKAIIESGLLREERDRFVLAGRASSLAIPESLQDSLTARLDRLREVKPVVQLAATLARRFSYSLLQAVWDGDDERLKEGLAKLVDAQLLYRSGESSDAEYTFKHALIQDAAYQSLLKSTRQRYHARIAQVLEQRFPEVAETRPELLAHHFTRAELPERAVVHWLRAGQAAIQRSAGLEAIAHLSAGLEVLSKVAETGQRMRQELEMLLAMGSALMTVRGVGHPDVEANYRRAQALWERLERADSDAPVRSGLWVYYGLWVHYFLRGKQHTALGLAEQLLDLAQRYDDRVLRVVAHTALGCGWFYLGDFARALEHQEQGIALYRPQEDRALVLRTAHDLGVVCLDYAAQTLWMLGYPDQALARALQALDLAQQEPPHAYSVSFALKYIALIQRMRRDVEEVAKWGEKAVALATEQGFPLHLSISALAEGWQRSMGDRPEQGIRQMHESLDHFRSTGAGLGVASYLGWLAEAYGRTGKGQAGLEVVEQALELAQDSGERAWESEHRRVKGELLLQIGGREAEAEAWMERALAVARQQGARLLELRAAVSLARCWRAQGNAGEAHALLAPIFESFTEGFATADLRDAEDLLEALEEDLKGRGHAA